MTAKCATLIDNVFVNDPFFKYLSGNITTSRPDHLPQFIIPENVKGSDLKKERKVLHTETSDILTLTLSKGMCRT